MISHQAEQQMDHPSPHTISPSHSLTSPSSLAASEATTSSSPVPCSWASPLPHLSPSSYPLACISPRVLPLSVSIRSLSTSFSLHPYSKQSIFVFFSASFTLRCSARIVPSHTCCSITPPLAASFSSSLSITFSSPPSVSFRNSGQLTWCMVLWDSPVGVTIVVSGRCLRMFVRM